MRSQILELLLELNESPEVPQSLRYNLDPSGVESDIDSTAHTDEQMTHESLRLGRYQVQKGETSKQNHQENRKKVLKAPEFNPSRSYAQLSKTNDVAPTPHDSTIDPSLPTAAGYLTIRQEEQYLQNLDSFLGGKSTHPRIHAMNSLGSKSAERTTDREREMQLRNPVSVYNWLRRHQPQVFLQDHETSNDKGSKISGSRSSKRTVASKEAKQEPEYYDEDGIALEYGAGSKGKRKRNDDGAFRPKGGKPGPGTKKRKDDSGKRSKRSSMDARAS